MSFSDFFIVGQKVITGVQYKEYEYDNNKFIDYLNFIDNDRRSFTNYITQNEKSIKDFKFGPIIKVNNKSYIYISVNDVYLVLSTEDNVNVMMGIDYLNNVSLLLKKFLGNVNYETIRYNRIFILQLMNETMDFGIIQTTEFNILKELLDIKSKNTPKINYSENKNELMINKNLTSTTPWRMNGKKYLENKIYIDIEEYIISVVNSKNESNIDLIGVVKMNAMLSGMPILSIQTKGNDAQDFVYHKSVKIENDDLVFVPMDEEFTLMTYKIKRNINNPVSLLCYVEIKKVFNHNRNDELHNYVVYFNLNIEKMFEKDLEEILVSIPLPETRAKIEYETVKDKLLRPDSRYIKGQDLVIRYNKITKKSPKRVLKFKMNLYAKENEILNDKNIKITYMINDLISDFDLKRPKVSKETYDVTNYKKVQTFCINSCVKMILI